MATGGENLTTVSPTDDLHRITVAEYERMAQAGLLERTQLVDSVDHDMAPQLDLHDVGEGPSGSTPPPPSTPARVEAAGLLSPAFPRLKPRISPFVLAFTRVRDDVRSGV